MDCTEIRREFLDFARGHLASHEQRQIEMHLRGCTECLQESVADRTLGEALISRLPRHHPPAALRRRLERKFATLPEHAQRRRWNAFPIAAAAAAVAMLAGGGAVYTWHQRENTRAAIVQLEREAVNDHLRVLYSDHPVGVQSGGIHQVKPWFEGRLEFAPVVGFEGNADFPLVGGAVGYFLDRKAAVFVYKRRLHTITLFVFKDESLPLPDGAAARTREGFHLVLWRKAGLGYALVSDLDMNELRALAALIAT
jgi:anti-sigma factor RsiW